MAKVEGNNYKGITGVATETGVQVMPVNNARHRLAIFNLGDKDNLLYIAVLNPVTLEVISEFDMEGGKVWAPVVPPTNPIQLRAASGATVDYTIQEG